MSRRQWFTGVVAGVGGLLLVSTLLVHWVTHGPGSTMAGHRLAMALRTVPGRAASAAELTGLAVYGIALLGALVVATCWFGHLAVVVTRAAAGLLVVAALAALVGGGVLPLGRWAAGPAMAAIGAALLVVPLVLAVVQRSRPRHRKGALPS